MFLPHQCVFLSLSLSHTHTLSLSLSLSQSLPFSLKSVNISSGEDYFKNGKTKAYATTGEVRTQKAMIQYLACDSEQLTWDNKAPESLR